MRKITIALFAVLGILLLLFSALVSLAAREALSLWASQVVPVLFPFFLCAGMIQRFYLGGLDPASLFLMSMIAGAPAGARLCACCALDEKSASRLCAALNMTGPMFITAAFCTSMLGMPRLAVPILLGQYLSAALALVSCRDLFPLAQPPQQKNELPLLQSLSEVIFDGVQAMLSIGGTIVAFRVFLAVLDAVLAFVRAPLAPAPLRALLFGTLEFVSGCAALSSCKLSAPAMAASAAFLFSFGGLCVMAQSMRYLPLHVPTYLIRKLVQALLAAFFAFLGALLLFPKDSAVFYAFDKALAAQNALSALGLFFASAFSLSVLWLLRTLLLHARKEKAARNRAAQ